MLNDAWLKYNDEILSSIENFKYEIFIKEEIFKFLKFFKDSDIVYEVFGEIGDDLYEFLNCIDTSHLEFNSFIESLLGIDAINEIQEILNLYEYANKNKYSNLIKRFKFLPQFFKKENILLNGRTLADPLITNIHTRFLTSDLIWQSRNVKKTQVINKNKILLQDNNAKYDLFNCYHHNSDKTNVLKAEFLKRKKIFQKLNCVQMSNEIDDAIKKLDTEVLKKHFGFRRITLGSVSFGYKEIFNLESDVVIIPVNSTIFQSCKDVQKLVTICDNFPVFGHEYPVFDHYALVGCVDASQFVLVGERDTQTFFLGYAHYE